MPPRSRGRPTVLDPTAVGAVALRLWADHGYEATTWDDIAAASGVSVRTLMRHFPSKAALAWVGVPAATHRLTDAFRTIPVGTPLPDALRTAVVASVSDATGSAAWTSAVTTEPELLAEAVRAYRPWTDALAHEIARRRPDAPPAICRALAAAYREAASVALVDWVDRDAPGSPAEAVDAVLRHLDLGISPA